MNFTSDHLWRREHPITEPIKVIRREMIDQWVAASADTAAYQTVGEISKTLQCALNHPDASIRITAIEALDTNEIRTGVRLLTQVVRNDPDWEVRVATVQALGRLCRQLPVEVVIAALREEQDENVREALVRALGKMGQRLPVHVVVTVLYEDDNWLVREAAAYVLGELDQQAPMNALIHALRCDQDESVRVAAARSLGRSGRHEAEQALFEALLDEDEEVREAASLALQQLDEETRGMDYKGYKTPQSGEIWRDSLYPMENRLEVRSNVLGTPVSPVYKQIERTEAVFATLINFIRDKKGCVRHRLIPTGEGQTLVFYCQYQQTAPSVVNHTLIHMPSAGLIIQSLERICERDEILRQVLTQAINTYEERPWEELLMVSFALSHPHGRARLRVPLRVVIAGMSYASIQDTDGFILDQMVSTWSKAVTEPLACKYPHDLIDFTIWCQPETLSAITPPHQYAM